MCVWLVSHLQVQNLGACGMSGADAFLSEKAANDKAAVWTLNVVGQAATN